MSNQTSEKPKEEVFTCRYCGNKTAHTLIKFHSVNEPVGRSPLEGEMVYSDDYFFLFECKTCKGISLKNVFSEELDYGPDYNIPFETINYLYPTARSLDEFIPKGLALTLNEANKVKFISPIAYAVLVRKVLDELCRERSIKERNLKENLKTLVHTEKLPDIFAKATDKLRLLGNIGAHESEIKINRDDSRLMEEFIFALIEYIYVMPAKLKKLNDALEKQKKIPTASSK